MSRYALKNELSDGHDEAFESIIIGDDLAALKEVSDLTKEDEQGEASTEALQLSVQDDGVAPKNDCCSGSEGCGCKPAVSRVIDAEGKAKVTIYLDDYSLFKHIGLIVGLIDAATENDVVDITVISTPCGMSGTIEHRSILSAISRCKAHVITRAGALTTFGEVAIWLSGKERRMSKMGAIFLRQPIAAYFGDTADYENQLKAFKDSLNEYRDFIADCGLFTKEELNGLYKHRGMLHLSYQDLTERIASLKHLD